MSESLQKWKQRKKKKPNETAPWRRTLVTSLLKMQGCTIALGFFLVIAKELCTMGSCVMFIFIVQHLKDPAQTWREGAILSLLFCTFIGLATLIKQCHNIRAGFLQAQFHRLITTLVYDKISRLSLNDLAQASEGKVVCIVNADLATLMD